MTYSLLPGVSALDVSAWFHVAETPSGQKMVVLRALCIKQIKNAWISYPLTETFAGLNPWKEWDLIRAYISLHGLTIQK